MRGKRLRAFIKRKIKVFRNTIHYSSLYNMEKTQIINPYKKNFCIFYYIITIEKLKLICAP